MTSLKFKILLAAVAIGAAILIVYGNTLRAPFVYDDIPAIVENPAIRHLGDLAVFSPSGDKGTGANSRPLVSLSLALNYAVGGLNPSGYHAANIALHIASALLLLGFVRRTLLLPGISDRLAKAAFPIACSTALLWAVHPLLSETVTCTIQRTEGLMAMFYLLTCYSYVRVAELGAVPQARRWRILAIAACFLGVMSKEVMGTAPVVLLVYDRVFVSGTFAAAWRRHRGLLLGLAASWVPLAALVIAGRNRGGTAVFEPAVAGSYLLTQCFAVVHYLRLALWPHPLVMDYGPYFVRGATDVLLQIVLLIAMLAGTVVALWRRPRIGFLGAWFFLILAPSSSIVPLVTQTIAEHRMYLPLAALIVAGVSALALAGQRIAWVAVAVLAVALGAATHRRNDDYRSPLSIWRVTARDWPSNVRAHSGYAVALQNEGRLEEALVEAAAAVARPPPYAENLGIHASILAELGRLPESVRQYEAALQLDPRSRAAHYNLGNVLARMGRFRDARLHYERALEIEPRDFGTLMNLGNVLAEAGEFDAAVTRFQAAMKIAPQNPEVYFNLGMALAENGRFADAIAAFRDTLRLNPGHREAASMLAEVEALTRRAP